MIEKIKEVLNERALTDSDNDVAVKRCWEKEIEVLSKDVDATISYLRNECSEEEYLWISEILDELALRTQSRELVDCYRDLRSKFPQKWHEYGIEYDVEDAYMELNK